MNPFINNITQDFIMSEMMRKQTNQKSTNCEFQNWIKSESVYNCERSTKRMEKASEDVKKAISRRMTRKTGVILTAICLGLFLLCFLLFLAAPDRFPKLPHLSLDTIFEAHASPAPVQTDTKDPASSKALEVYVLDVGQGDCIFLLSPDGRNMLIDTGEAQYYSVIESFLKNKGREKIENGII